MPDWHWEGLARVLDQCSVAIQTWLSKSSRWCYILWRQVCGWKLVECWQALPQVTSVLMAAVVCVDSTSFSFMESFWNASVLNPPTKFREPSFVQILLYRRPKKHSCDKSMDRQCTYQHCRNWLQFSWQLSFLLFPPVTVALTSSKMLSCPVFRVQVPILDPSNLNTLGSFLKMLQPQFALFFPGFKEWVRWCRCSGGCSSPCTCIWFDLFTSPLNYRSKRCWGS